MFNSTGRSVGLTYWNIAEGNDNNDDDNDDDDDDDDYDDDNDDNDVMMKMIMSTISYIRLYP